MMINYLTDDTWNTSRKRTLGDYQSVILVTGNFRNSIGLYISTQISGISKQRAPQRYIKIIFLKKWRYRRKLTRSNRLGLILTPTSTITAKSCVLRRITSYLACTDRPNRKRSCVSLRPLSRWLQLPCHTLVKQWFLSTFYFPTTIEPWKFFLRM